MVLDLSSIGNAFFGGLLIGLAALFMLFFNGRILGISGIVGGLFNPNNRKQAWRFYFFLGIFFGSLALNLLLPECFSNSLSRSNIHLILAGILVGWGTRLGNGCTSGHGVCGVSRLSPRSLVATGVFMISGILTVWIMTHWELT